MSPKLNVGTLEDPLEREAERVAAAAGRSGKEHGDAPRFQSAAVPQQTGSAPAVVHEALRAAGRPLDGSILPLMNRRFQYDFSTVRIHDDALSGRAAASLHAAAFTAGKDIFFAPGRPAASTTAGRRLIAHELAHVVQQGRGGFTIVQRSPKDPKEDPATKLERKIAEAAAKLTALESLKAKKEKNEKREQRNLTLHDTVPAYDAVHSVMMAARATQDPASLERFNQLQARYESIVRGTEAAKPGSHVPLPAASTQPMTAQESSNLVRAQRGFDSGLNAQAIEKTQRQIRYWKAKARSLKSQSRNAPGSRRANLTQQFQRLYRDIKAATERIAVSRPTLKDPNTLERERKTLQAELNKGRMKPGRRARVEARIATLNHEIEALASGRNRLPLSAYQGGRLGGANRRSNDPYDRLQWHQKTYVTVQVIHADGTAGPVFQARNNPAADRHSEDDLIDQMTRVSDHAIFRGATLVISGDQEVCSRCAPRVQQFAGRHGVAKVIGSTEHGPRLNAQGQNTNTLSSAKTLTGKVSDPGAVEKMERAQQGTRRQRAGGNEPQQEYRLRRSYTRKTLFPLQPNATAGGAGPSGPKASSAPPVSVPVLPPRPPSTHSTSPVHQGEGSPSAANQTPSSRPAAPARAKQAPRVAVKPNAKVVAQGDAAPADQRHGGVLSGQGDLIGVERRNVVSGEHGGTPFTTTTGTRLALRADGTIAATREATHETVIGTDSFGRPITQTRSAQAGLAISEKGATAHAGISRQTAGGGTHSLGGSATVDASGNVSGQLSYSYLTKTGVSFTPSVSASYEVQASDVIALDNGKFAVTFGATSTKGVGFGASKQFSGGPSIGVDVGTTEGTMDTGTRIFDDENKAKEFKAHAALYIEQERLGEQQPPSSVDGALAIPIGETRGSGQLSGKSIGGSVSFEGATFGVGHHTTDIQQFEVTHVSRDAGGDIFQAQATMTGSKGTDVSLSGGIGLTRGGSNTRSFAVTWEFNLATASGKAAFEQYARTLIPPFGAAKLVAMEALDSEEDHDQVSIPLLGTAKWTGSTWEITRVDQRGTHQQFGGEQSRDQDPSFLGRHLFGQDEIHSKAQIVSKLENGKEAGFEAQMTVSGDSGDATREALGEIFMGARHEGDTTASGEWTLSATIDPKVVHELERYSKEFREAASNEDKLRIYSKLVKENGARMLGGQVRSGGDALAWNLQLKGDKNFPGPAGRNELERKQADLRQRLQAHPENASTVVTDAQATLKQLHTRRDAVADKSKYTDLPDELRDEQLKLIDQHIADFEFVSSQASQEAIKAAPGEKIEATRARQKDKGGYTDTNASADAIDLLKLRDKIAEKQAQIHEIDPKILEAIAAVQQAQHHTRRMTASQWALAQRYRADYNLHWATANTVNDRQFAMAPKAEELRLKMLDEQATPADRKTVASALQGLMSERVSFLQILLNELNSSAEALKPITTERGMAGHERYWAGIKADELPGPSEDDL